MKRWLPLLVVLLAGCQMDPGTHNVALLYGVTNYGTGANNLLFPALDVGALAPLLSRNSGGLYQVTARTDSSATKAQIEADFAAAAQTLDENSVFLFYFGGHGQQGITAPSVGGVDGHAILLPYGSVTATVPVIDASQTITEDELRALLQTLPTKKVVVILDACFSGGFIHGVASDGTPLDSNAYYAALWRAFLSGQAPDAATDLSAWLSSVDSSHAVENASWVKAIAGGTGIDTSQAQVLTAAGALEESYDATAFQHGAFTYFLLEAAQKGDADGDGVVTVSEAFRYAFRQIQEQWNGVWGAVGYQSFATTTQTFLPHLSNGPIDYVLFRK